MLAEAAAGGAPPEEFSLIREFDETFLGHVTRGDLAPLDEWQPQEVVATAGIGAMEILTWLAAASCASEMGAANPSVQFYDPIIEFGVGFGLIESAA
jgi:2,3-dihydroxyphenylpropionate 1,2-dioxygenase